MERPEVVVLQRFNPALSLFAANEKIEDVNSCPKSHSQMVSVLFFFSYNVKLTA